MSREVSRSQRDWLEGEIAVWQATGLVDEELRERSWDCTNRGNPSTRASSPGDCSHCLPWRRFWWGSACCS